MQRKIGDEGRPPDVEFGLPLRGAGEPALNRKFPACAGRARWILAGVYGCKPGDPIPPEKALLARAAEVAAGLDTFAVGEAANALAMVAEIGGLFER
jgi:hypothetical protein